MPYPIAILRAGTLRARQLVPPLLAVMLLGVAVLLSPSLARGGFVSNTATVSALWGDDNNTSTLNPYPMIPVSTITYPGHPELTGQCTWINVGLNAYIKANAGWTYHWAGVTQEAKVEAGISLVPYNVVTRNPNGTTTTTTYSGYNPFVVSAPEVTGAPGSGQVFPQRPPGELGGAVLNLQYGPVQGAPSLTADGNKLEWIQAYTGTIYGNAFGPFLDNDPTQPYKGQNNAGLPFYDGTYTAGTLDGGGGWFLDTPFVTEQEYESNPVVNAQFQVVLADYDATNKKLTLYGGEWWGFNYSAVDTPEPATCLLMTIGGGGLLFFRRMTGRRSAA